MKRKRFSALFLTLISVCALFLHFEAHTASLSLEEGFADPPQQYGVRCWWWWLNSNVTKEAITRDLEQMKAKGFSGAMIFDAGGADQRGNRQVPPGPTYASPAWRELYKHALQEAQRLGLEMGLSIQSGWNLGGPNVTPEFAAKQLTFSEMHVEGPAELNQKLPLPQIRGDFYRDICILAYPKKPQEKSELDYEIIASSFQQEFPKENAIDGNVDTYWVSSGRGQGKGPSASNPEWIELVFPEKKTISGCRILGRKGYGPKQCQIQYSNDRVVYTTIRKFSVEDGQECQVDWPPVTAASYRILVEDAYDSRYPDAPRNVQIAELSLRGQQGSWIIPKAKQASIQNLQLKSMYRELGGSAPDCRFLLNDLPASPGEEDAKLDHIRNITDCAASDGVLTWSAPAGEWIILRFGYTLTSAHVSTYSADWHGLVIDYLRKEALQRYWDEVAAPLIEEAGSLAGDVLKQLETDSWECGGMNWTDRFEEEFKKYRGYDPIPYLPIFAGKIVENRDVCNRFLADFRKTLADCVADNHYRHFADLAHQHNLEIQPESGGPHAGPFDALKNLGKNDIVMGEFWVPSPHRPKPENRFFIKQSSSAAHIYGKRYVGAESFTSIGPHWDDVLWKSQKPSADHEFCSGLNMVFFHTFTCSPKEMGIPGQEYFAGTHINPQVTWWDYSDAFISYLNRCQFLFQQGSFIADVLYYYGDHVPNLVRLKEDDPAQVLPGYDYDVVNEEILLRLKVENECIVVPGGVRYRLLVLPDHKALSLAALEKIEQLLQQGAVIVGLKPDRLVSLVGGEAGQQQFHESAARLWGENPEPAGRRKIGKGSLIWGKATRQILLESGVNPDFMLADSTRSADFDYIHYKIDQSDIYFVCNQTEKSREELCSLRIQNRQPELWDPITGDIRDLTVFTQKNGLTEIPLRFTPYGAWFIVFRNPISPDSSKQGKQNFLDLNVVQTIESPWRVAFDPEWGGPSSVQFDSLISWTDHSDPGIKFYSGKAVYEKKFDFVDHLDSSKRLWLDLGEVKDVGIAAVRLNGRNAGIVWTPPFRVEITDFLEKGENHLEITIINTWRNRLVGDRDLPDEEKYTQTNITIKPEWKLLPSGLLGPVAIITE
ncbi:MAG: discoidin domain-containing protein [Candidatus Omnitrophica bacterium]|nr:discoidin domain-containing protein [Candidatus Omnitrophota bacterium]